MRQADAGVAGGALDDGAAGPQRARSCSASRDDVQRGAVLDRLAGIHELGLAQDVAAGQLGGASQPDQRRVADGVEDVLLDLHCRHGAPIKSRSRARVAGREWAR